MNISRLKAMILKEVATKTAWNSMNSIERAAYIEAYPASRFAAASIHIKHPGALHDDLGIPQGEKIPAKKLNKALHSDDPKLRKRAQFAKNAAGWKH